MLETLNTVKILQEDCDKLVKYKSLSKPLHSSVSSVYLVVLSFKIIFTIR